MKLSQRLGDLRTTTNGTVVREIETICPADWGTEQLFEKSFRKYEAQSGIRVHRPRTRVRQAVGLAACLLVTLGLSVGVWNHQQPIESRPPQENAVLPTDTTEETKPADTEDFAETSKETETTAQHVTEADTQDIETTAQNAPQTIMQTESVKQSLTEPTEAPVTPTEAVPMQTEAAALPIVPIVTEPQATPTEMPETATEAEPVLATERLNGFRVMQYPNYRQVVCTDAFPTPDGVLNPYTVEDERMTLLNVADAENGEATRSYEIEKDGKQFTVIQQEYEEFVLNVDEGDDLIDLGVSRFHGFFLLQGEQCTVYWFCDGEGFCISGDAADLSSFLAIVRSFTPTA